MTSLYESPIMESDMNESKDVIEWTMEDLVQKMTDADIPQTITDVVKNSQELKVLLGKRKTFVNTQVGGVKKSKKVFSDPIHGHIELHPLCIAIINTPQFQRLRFCKRIGLCSFVFPGAEHNRLEHSIGVCHLAGQLARSLQEHQPSLGITEQDILHTENVSLCYPRSLQEHQPSLGITEQDILCVEVAGLCFNLGRGPFSRLYNDRFLSAVYGIHKNIRPTVAMFEHLIEDNKLRDLFDVYGLSEADVHFIKEQLEVIGPTGSTCWPYKGRTKEKAFLYEIVCNRRNGIDVYKMDYIARDCHYLGIQSNFDFSRYIKFARVLESDGEWQICTRDKEIGNLYNLFYTRYKLNKTAYNDKVVSAIEIMVTDALKYADDFIKFKGSNDRVYKLSECHKDMKAFTQATDNVLVKILEYEGDQSGMVKAKQIVENIIRRQLYTCVFESRPIGSSHVFEDTARVTRELAQKVRASQDESNIYVEVISRDFGMKDENPVLRLKAYTKRNPTQAKHLPNDEESRILNPSIFNEFVLRVYSRDRDQTKCRELDQAAAAYFTGWMSFVTGSMSFVTGWMPFVTENSRSYRE